jgi:hypothetical protein
MLGLSALLSFSFSWLVVDAVAMALTGANLFGYMKASSDAQTRLRSAITGGAMAGLSMIPGAFPALGSTIASFMTTAAVQAATAVPATPTAAAGATAPQVQRPGDAKAARDSEHNPFDERVVL